MCESVLEANYAWAGNYPSNELAAARNVAPCHLSGFAEAFKSTT